MIDSEIILKAVKSSGSALKYASDDLKADRKIVMQGVKPSENWLFRNR